MYNLNDSTSGWNAFLSGYTVYYQHYLDDVLEEVIILINLVNIKLLSDLTTGIYLIVLNICYIVSLNNLDVEVGPFRIISTYTKNIIRYSDKSFPKYN